MGLEARYIIKEGRQVFEGKILLEGEYIIFRGDKKEKIAIKNLIGVESKDDILILNLPKQVLKVQLDGPAEKWPKKILNPTSRLDKLGVKKHDIVRLIGDFESDFLGEFKAQEVTVLLRNAGKKENATATLILLRVEQIDDLKKLSDVSKTEPTHPPIWIVYPKGKSDVTQSDVMETGRSLGLKDTKVMSFSAEFTALRFNRSKS